MLCIFNGVLYECCWILSLHPGCVFLFCGLGKRLVELSCCQTVLLAHIAHATSSGRHKMDPPNWFPPSLPGTYFTAKYGLPLKI